MTTYEPDEQPAAADPGTAAPEAAAPEGGDPFSERELPAWLREPQDADDQHGDDQHGDEPDDAESLSAEGLSSEELIAGERVAAELALDDEVEERIEEARSDAAWTEGGQVDDGWVDAVVSDAVRAMEDDAPRPVLDEASLEARRAIEAVVLAATEPVEPRFLAELVELPVARVEELCADLTRDYEEARRGFVLARVAGGYRFQTHPDLSPYVERFVLEGQHVRLSGAALETLAIVAYKQPIARGQVSAIRGVNVETTLQTLVARGYVADIGRDPGPGLAVLYGTTPAFLDRLGLDTLEDLPPLGDFVPDAGIVELLERGLRIPDDAFDELDGAAPVEGAVDPDAGTELGSDDDG